MVSETPDQPFHIVSSVPMFGGAELPAVGAATTGSPLLDTSAADGLAVSPEKAVAAYAAAIAQPKGKPSDAVSADDPFAAGLRTTAAAQAKALGKLGTLTQKHEPLLEQAVTFRLADGGAVTFGLMRRTDTIAVKPTAKELVLPAEYAKVTGKKKVDEVAHPPEPGARRRRGAEDRQGRGHRRPRAARLRQGPLNPGAAPL